MTDYSINTGLYAYEKYVSSETMESNSISKRYLEIIRTTPKSVWCKHYHDAGCSYTHPDLMYPRGLSDIKRTEYETKGKLYLVKRYPDGICYIDNVDELYADSINLNDLEGCITGGITQTGVVVAEPVITEPVVIAEPEAEIVNPQPEPDSQAILDKPALEKISNLIIEKDEVIEKLKEKIEHMTEVFKTGLQYRLQQEEDKFKDLQTRAEKKVRCLKEGNNEHLRDIEVLKLKLEIANNNTKLLRLQYKQKD